MAVKQMQEPEYDEFNSPIPGQSLTDEPGKWAWEQPPRYSKVEDVADVLMERLFEKENTKQILTMLDSGIPVEGVAKTILFTGFAEGEYSPDVMILLGRLVFEAILTIGMIGKVGDLKIRLSPEEKEKDDFNFEMAQIKFAQKMANKPKKKEEVKEDKEQDAMGIMAKPMEEEE
jgi:hypothetical protein